MSFGHSVVIASSAFAWGKSLTPEYKFSCIAVHTGLVSATIEIPLPLSGRERTMTQSAGSQTRVFPHAMLCEIYEQPEALAATIARYAPNGLLSVEAFAGAAEALRGRQRIVIAASGSSRHAGLAGEIMLE